MVKDRKVMPSTVQIPKKTLQLAEIQADVESTIACTTFVFTEARN